MKVLIVGTGKMGIRHAEGIASMSIISEICLSDISVKALEIASNKFSSNNDAQKFSYVLTNKLNEFDQEFDIAIIASTASERLKTIKLVLKTKVKYILLEKPLGQNLDEVRSIIDYFKNEHPEKKVYINHSMRLSLAVIELKKDIETLPQMAGPKTIMLNTGAVGIGANGIHYLDLIFFLLNAEKAIIKSAEIDDDIIPSGRGPQFADFGGWAVIEFYDNKNKYLGKAFISMRADSSLAGSIDIVSIHGRILFDEIKGTRIDMLRKSESTLPVYRYHADYMPDETKYLKEVTIPELTQLWIEDILNGVERLPKLQDSFKVHQLMFEWLSYSKTHQIVFPIT